MKILFISLCGNYGREKKNLVPAMGNKHRKRRITSSCWPRPKARKGRFLTQLAVKGCLGLLNLMRRFVIPITLGGFQLVLQAGKKLRKSAFWKRTKCLLNNSFPLIKIFKYNENSLKAFLKSTFNRVKLSSVFIKPLFYGRVNENHSCNYKRERTSNGVFYFSQNIIHLDFSVSILSQDKILYFEVVV